MEERFNALVKFLGGSGRGSARFETGGLNGAPQYFFTRQVRADEPHIAQWESEIFHEN
jgi:hypothetical protein